jgi:hypothetical protein
MLGQYKKHAEWRDGIYENRYERGPDGIWRIKALHLYVNFVAPYEKGWAQALAGTDLLTVSAVAGYVRNGIVVGFDVLGGRPRMLVHLSQAKAQHVDFQATVLRLMTVYQ